MTYRGITNAAGEFLKQDCCKKQAAVYYSMNTFTVQQVSCTSIACNNQPEYKQVHNKSLLHSGPL